MDDIDRDSEGFIVLHRKFSDLYKSVNYRAKQFTYIQNRITEYDIHSANLTMLSKYKKLKTSTLEELQLLPKHERQVIIGKLQKKDPSTKKIIARGIIEAKRDLFMANGIQDDEILSIKNDAVFIIGRKLKETTFGVVEFRPKHTYSLFIYQEGLEFYYDGKNHDVTIKGVSDKAIEDPDIQRGIMEFLRTAMRYLSLDQRDKFRRYMIEFSDAYKKKELPVEYYKELTGNPIYRTDMEINGYSFNLSVAGNDDKGMLNGTYNYIRYVLPFIQNFL